MSKATVKKALSRLDRDSLVDLLMGMYAVRKEAKEYLEFWTDPDIDREFGQAMERIRKLYFQGADKPRQKVHAADVSAVLKNFRTLCPDAERTAQLMLHAGETHLQWLVKRNGRGMATQRPKLDTMVKNTRELIDKEELGVSLGERLNRLEETINHYYENHTPPTGRRRRGFWRW